MESFGGLISDVFITVSKGYLKSDILPIVGRIYDLKSDYVWNGCDWEVSNLEEDVFRRLNSITEGNAKIEELK